MPDRPFDPFVPPVDEAPEDTLAPEASEASSDWLAQKAVRVPLLVVGLMALFGAVVLGLSQFTIQAASQNTEAAETADELPVLDMAPGEPYTFSSLENHPDRMFSDYFGGAFLASAEPDSAGELDRDFHYRLEMYRKAYGVDDNFTIRVLDERTGETLEVFTLLDLKTRFEATGEIDWQNVDFPNRRSATTRLRDKWQARGIPREAITIRWGRTNQTLEARERDEPFLPYEVQLTRRLGLSLLATEIGTVETFNQDNLVSSVGARSRYQMMPDILQMYDVETYTVSTTAGTEIQVREVHHPLLSMEPSLMLVRSYSNAVGHELPGISAYHTGPGNIFHLYQAYLRAHAANPPVNGHVSDAYMWGITDGFDRVRAQSSFGPESRAYVMKAYGALRATEDKLIDPSRMIRAERVQLRPGTSLTLEQLLTALSGSDQLNWGEAEGSLYNRFKTLNPHFELPPALVASGVPERGNVRFTSSTDGKPIRFFLPLGSVDILRRVGLDVFGDVFVFDENTYRVDPSEITPTDRAYAALVERAGNWGFTMANKRELDNLVDRLDALAAQNPTRYRQTQARIARLHRSLWNTRSFRDLMGTAETLLSIVPQRRALEAAAEPADAAVDG